MNTGSTPVHISPVVTLNHELKSLFPAAPAQMLLVGFQLGDTGRQLQDIGYEVHSYPLESLSFFSQYPTGSRQGILQVDLGIPPTGEAKFDLALVVGISPKLNPLSLWDQLGNWLKVNAKVVLVGTQTSESSPRVAHWLDYAVAMAGRCGFAPQDIAESVVTPTDNAFVRVLQRTQLPRWQLRHMRKQDYLEIAVLFQEVFGHDLSPELWEWKYANGHGNAVLASRDGVLVAHYGGMYREILLCGKPDWAYGGSDVMVHPKERGVMTRQGPFLLTAATTAELYGPVAFGFPTERAMLVAERMGLYTKAGQMAEIRWEPAAPRLRLGTRVRALRHGNAADQALVDGLWKAMAFDLQDSVVGVRDWKFMDHRYFDHPHNKYEVLAVVSRWTGKALGVMVLRRLETCCELLDVIAPLENLKIVIDQAQRMTARWSLRHLYCWITTNQAQHFVACGGKQEPLNMFIPTSSWTDDPRVEMLIDKWWLMSGDTDFR